MIWAFLSLAMADTVRLGLFVGNNIGFGQDEPLAHAEREARDVARLFQEMGDLDKDRTTIVQGGTLRDVRAAITALEAQSREVEARGDDPMLLFYYSGHASQEGLHLTGTLLPMAELRRWLEGSTAQVRLAFVDACESGTLARTRGGTPVETVNLTVDDALTMSGLAIVTSTGPLSVARESTSIGGGIFSQALITGLRGGADRDADGQITLEEAYEHAFAETVISTSTSEAAIQRPEYRFDLEGVGQVVLTRIPSRAAGLVLPEELEGVYTVVSVSSGQVVARVDKKPGEPSRLALPPGRYVVRKVRAEDVLLAELDLVWGGDRWVSDTQMSTVALGDPLSRGGWSLRPMTLTVRGGVTTPPLLGNPMSWQGEAEGRYRLSPGLSIAALAGGGSGIRGTWTGNIVSSELRAGLGLYGERHLTAVDLYIGGGPHVARFSQRIDYLDFESDEDFVFSSEVLFSAQWTVGGWAGAGVHVPVGPVFGLELAARMNVNPLRVNSDESIRASVSAGAFLGLSAGIRRKMARAQRTETP